MDLEVTLLSDAHAYDWSAEVSWTADDPLVVQFEIPCDARGEVVWEVAREILAAGLAGEVVGLGDVMVLPDLWDAHNIEIIFSSPTGRCALLVDRIDLAVFVEATWRRCPPGAEQIPVPDAAEFAAGLEGESR